MTSDNSSPQNSPVVETTVTAQPEPTGSFPSGTSTNSTEIGTDGVGRTIIENIVVGKIAGLATREVSGVHSLGGGAARVMGSLRDTFGGSGNVQQGVSVEVGERQAAVDLSIVAEYGVAIHELAEAIRRNIIRSIERMTGLEVTEVNITVTDVHLPQDDHANREATQQTQTVQETQEIQPSRVQ